LWSRGKEPETTPKGLPKYFDGVCMKKVEEYLQHAAECREMLITALPQHREQLEQMAKTWEQLAEARQRIIDQKTK